MIRKWIILYGGICLVLLPQLSWKVDGEDPGSYEAKASQFLYEQVLREASWAMRQEPITVTASLSPRSEGGKHDFFSEGDYWWPDEQHPEGPYIRKDGLSNPDNFVAHREAMIRFSRVIGSLASAYKITHRREYVKQALIHLKAWFVDSATYMSPHLKYAQAIKGIYAGRGIGIIDTIHLLEVAQGILVMQDDPEFSPAVLVDLKKWFASYLSWLTSHLYGIDEMNAENNHGTCWVMQVASFAKLTADSARLAFCRNRFKEVLLPGQMATDGSFPKELARTKPYGYSLFNLDAMATLCQILSTPEDDLWKFQLADGRSMRTGMDFMFPYIAHKERWPYAQDVMYWKEWPVAQPSLLFCAQAYHQEAWFDLWRELKHDPQEEEVLRNLPIRNPLIWL